MAATVRACCCSSAEIVARQVPLLGAVVAELGVVAALDLHNVLRIVDVILHALVERAVDGQGLFRWVVPVDVCPQQDEAVHLVRVACCKLGGHGAAHGVSGDVPVPDVRELLHDIFRRVRVKDRHAEGHVDQDSGDAGLPDLRQQGQICLAD